MSRLLAPLAGLALAGSLVAGCAPAPGTAATVDGEVIGEAEVAEVVEQVSPFLTQPMTPQQAVNYLIVSPEVLDVAAEAGISVSESQVVDTLAQGGEQLGLDPGELGEASVLVARRIMVDALLQQSPDAAAIGEQIVDRIAELDVEVNPRYGTWDGSQLAPSAPEWIVQPSPETA